MISFWHLHNKFNSIKSCWQSGITELLGACKNLVSCDPYAGRADPGRAEELYGDWGLREVGKFLKHTLQNLEKVFAFCVPRLGTVHVMNLGRLLVKYGQKP